MKRLISLFYIFISLCFFPSAGFCLEVGIGKWDITPPSGTPSAGYENRKGRGMEGVHDPLEATAVFIDNGSKKMIICGVDNLGFPYELIQRVIKKTHESLPDLEIYIGSSHTHSGGGAFLKIPIVGEVLAGKYDEQISQFYIDGIIQAILEAHKNKKKAKIGIGYGQANEELALFRSSWPAEETKPLSNIAVIKITDEEERPLGLIFNYAIHPTVLDGSNNLFSSDLVGYARNHLQKQIGHQVQAVFINGAQAEILPAIFNPTDRYASADITGKSLADSVAKIWNEIDVSEELKIKTFKEKYSFTPQPTPQGITLPLKTYDSEINLIVLNDDHAFLTVPGELSSLYDAYFKEKAKELGYKALSIFGLLNDAHGYIIYPEAWRNKTYESRLSFGGELYGDTVKDKIEVLLKKRDKG